MAKGKSTWKYNKLLTARRNYFLTGGQANTRFDFTSNAYHGYRGDSNATADFVKSANANGAKIDTNNLPGSLGGGKIGSSGFLGLDWSNPFKGADGATAKNALVNAAGSAIGGIGGGLLSGGMTSTAGNVLSGLSGIASAIPGPWGAAISAGLGLVSGLTNRMFGSKMNTENIAKVEANINNLNNFQSNASDFDTLSHNWANADVGMTFDDSFIGEDGWFSNKAKNKAADLRNQMEAGNAWVQNTLINNAENISTAQMQNLLSNYAAFGGPLLYSKGGSIHIKPENKGKFTETKRRTGKTTEELTHSSNPLTRKRAIFAQNAKKWHHAFGGELNTQGGDFTNGLLYIDNGGSHESNPYEGVQLGVDPEGTPNLVEEGETVFNDYVFSKRLKVPKAIRDKYKMRSTKEMTFAEMSKEMAKESEERPNDPISMRGLEALMADLANTQEGLKAMQKSNQFANGGKVNKFGDGGGWTPSKINTYGYIKDGYYGLGDAPFWIKDGQYTDEYKAFINDENRYNVDAFRQHLKDQFNFYDTADETAKKSNRYKAIKYFIDANKDWYDNRGSIDSWAIDGNLMKQARAYALSKPGFMHPETVAAAALSGKDNAAPKTAAVNRYFTYGTTDPLDYFEGRDEKGQTWLDLHPGYSFVDRNGTVRDPVDVDGVSTTYTDYYLKKNDPEVTTAPEEEEWKQGKYADWLRYAPAVGLGIAALTDQLGLTNKPDYTNADAILEATRGAGTYQPVRFKPVGNYLTYRPFDRDFYINKMNAEAGATRRSLLNTSSGNRATAMAGILAADNNYLNQIGGLARQAEEYNLAQRAQVEEFNRGTNTTNSQGFLQADIANQKALMDLGEFSLKGTMAAAQMKEAARLAADQSKSANVSGLFQTLGDIGFEEKNARMRDWAITHGVWGPGTESAGRFKKKEKKTTGNKTTSNPKAKGGKLNRKRKGLTF